MNWYREKSFFFNYLFEREDLDGLSSFSHLDVKAFDKETSECLTLREISQQLENVLRRNSNGVFSKNLEFILSFSKLQENFDK